MPNKPQQFEFPTYTREHPVTGEMQERVPDTPSQEVNLVADGWRKKPTKAAAKSTPATPTAKPSGGSNT